MRVLIDTDILIDYLRGDNSIRKQLEAMWSSGIACVSVLSVYELYAGARAGEDVYISNLLAPMEILSVSQPIAVVAGDRRNSYRRKGISLGDIDCMIAATAISEKMQVFTRNVKHYPEIDLYR